MVPPPQATTNPPAANPSSGAVVTPPASCYRALCNDPDQNPLGKGQAFTDQLLKIYDSFEAVSANPPSPSDILDSVLLDMDDGMIGGLLMFRETTPPTGAGGEAIILHNLKKHTSRASAFRGQVFAYTGDVMGQDIELVHLDDTDMMFAAKAETVVSKDIATHQALLIAAPNEAVLDP